MQNFWELVNCSSVSCSCVFFGHSSVLGAIDKVDLVTLDLIPAASVAVKTKTICLLTSPFPTVCCWVFFCCFFLLELAGENGCGREAERLGFGTAQGGWTWRGEGATCAPGPAAGGTGEIHVCGTLWDIPRLAVPWKRAKVRVEQGLGRAGGFWVVAQPELVSDSMWGLLKLGKWKILSLLHL